MLRSVFSEKARRNLIGAALRRVALFRSQNPAGRTSDREISGPPRARGVVQGQGAPQRSSDALGDESHKPCRL